MLSKSWLQGRAGLLLLLAPLLAVGCSGPDRPVTNGGDGTPSGAGGMTEGIEGRVTAPGTEPLEGVAVRPRSLDQPAAAIPEMAVVSEPDGHYSWRLSPGEYEIAFALEGYQPAAQRVTVRPRQITRLDVVLAPAP